MGEALVITIAGREIGPGVGVDLGAAGRKNICHAP
jgi:hypothetical protein